MPDGLRLRPRIRLRVARRVRALGSLLRRRRIAERRVWILPHGNGVHAREPDAAVSSPPPARDRCEHRHPRRKFVVRCELVRLRSECGFCPTGTVCTLANQTLQCLPPLLPETDASIDIRDASSSFDASLFDAAFTLDATPEDGGFVAEAGGGATCNSDAQCATTVGAKCIDGLCAAQSQLCSDGTQCLVAGDSCVDGTCVPPCSHAAPFCPTGYQCDFNRSACSVNPGVCASTGDCQGGAVCVDTHCVAPCSSADAGSQCVAGQVCVNGGCIPDQQARFACRNDGNQGSLANSCDPDSVCLHGDCYPGCDAEGGGCAATGESCKAVKIAEGD